MVQRGKNGECRAFWVTERGEGEGTAWWWDSQQWYRCLFFRWSQNLCHLVCFLHSIFLLIHISTLFSFFLRVSVSHKLFSLPLPFFSIFFLPRMRPYISKSHFDCLVVVGFSPMALVYSWALHIFSLWSSFAKENMDFSKLFSTRKDQAKEKHDAKRENDWKVFLNM